ncbi:hypothetical protein L3Q72_01905 [Vibrio sp. JC009]|uniref:hypothetical protein n=1 Tax=Vibrio sp. JC009 TaxID=2912314 RepID=UPI0023AE9FC8|nr:hypothetical protein [Vibrio sp. JC009]WED22191.1 hypothetical protein L3Q72_01905 [Vibrio sp. JC009]
MEYVDALGYAVPVIIAISLAAKDVVTMRVLNTLVCALCLGYGVLSAESSIVTISGLVLLANTYSVLKAYRSKQMRQKVVTSKLKAA